VNNKQCKVLILSQLFYPELVSTGQTLTELAEELVKQGMQVDVICGQSTHVDRVSITPRFMRYKGINIRRVYSTRLSKFNQVYKMINQITYSLSLIVHLIQNKSEKTILVFTNPSFAAFIVALLRKFGGSPYIFTIYDVHPDAAFKMGMIKENGIIVKVWDFLNKIAFKYSSAVVVLGRCMADKMRSPRKLEETQNKLMHIINIWSDDKVIKYISPQNNRLITEWGLEDKFIVGYSGNFGRFHELETIMKTAKELQGKDDIHFVFIGEGYKKKWCVEYAKKWDLNNCQFHGYVDKNDLAYTHSLMDVGLVSLSLGQEGLSVPSKMYGILAAKTPVIALMKNETETAQILHENNCGKVVNPGVYSELLDSIMYFYDNPDIKNKMGKNGQKAIKEKYNVRVSAQKYIDLINSISNNKNLNASVK
jgi:glycosyltransferase involved in cell wall biosynthesis